MRGYLIVMLTVFCLAMQIPPHPVQAQETPVSGAVSPEKQEGETKATDQKQEEKAQKDQTYAIEPVVVTATRTEVPIAETTKSIDVVTQKDMATQQQTFMPESLDSVPA